ncbi:MAG: hypothetical protein N3D11_11225 [Candidatus Sumerlaeia bacterium]|nr:hypothetical protein [Candidatus Sumerlaeia bacterium]
MNSTESNSNSGPRAVYSFGVAAVVIVLALLARGLIYFRIEDLLHADEALQGLIARHILGGEIQVFTYGLPYLGTLQAHWIALCFAALGQSTPVLKWAAGVESLLLVGAVYLLARTAADGNRRAGLFAALLTALGPLYLIEWSLRPRGGHLEVATLSALALWALLKTLGREVSAQSDIVLDLKTNVPESESSPSSPSAQSTIQNPQSTILWFALLGFLLGLGWWTHLTMFPAIATAAVAVVLWGRGVRGKATGVAVALLAFVVGSAPFWLYNIKYSWRTLAVLANGVQDALRWANLPERLDETVAVALPILLGARQTEAAQSFGPAFVLWAVAAYGTAFLAALLTLRRAPATCRRAVAILLLFSAVALGVWLAGPFRGQARDPHVLLPLYATLPVLAGVGLARWHTVQNMFRHLALVPLAALLLVHVAGYRHADRLVIQPSLNELRVPPDLDMVRLILESNNATHIFTNYYLGYRLAFESRETILACTDGDPGPERYQPFADRVRATTQPIAYVAAPRMTTLLCGALKEKGIGWKETKVHGLHIVVPTTNTYRQWPPSLALCVPTTITVGDYPKTCRPGTSFTVPVTVTNRSVIPWLAVTSDTCVVQLSYHLVEPATGRMVRQDNPRLSPVPPQLARGTSATIQMIVEAPSEPGRYAFVPNLLVEYFGWLSRVQPDLTARANWREFECPP